MTGIIFMTVLVLHHTFRRTKFPHWSYFATKSSKKMPPGNSIIIDECCLEFSWKNFTIIYMYKKFTQFKGVSFS